MQEYKIPVEYSSFGFIEIKANSIEEAYDIFKVKAEELPLPDDPEYIDGTTKIAIDSKDEKEIISYIKSFNE